MQCDQVRNYFADYLKEELEGATQTEFAHHLKGCPACNAELDALTELWVKLGSVPPGESASQDMDVRFRNVVEEYKQELNSRQSVPPSWTRGAALIAAATTVFVVVLSTAIVRSPLWNRSAPDAVVEIVSGSLYRIGGGKMDPMHAGDSIRLGDVVRSNGGDGAVLALADGSSIEMRSQSELLLESADDGVRIRLNGGAVIVSAVKQRTGNLYVQTKDLTLSVVGTVFLVNAEAAGSRVAVIEGEVQVEQGSTAKKLLPGEQVATNWLMESHPVREEISWSRNAETHTAHLQESAAATGGVQASPRLEFEVASVRPVLLQGSDRRRMPVFCQGIDGFLPSAPPANEAVPLGRCVGRASLIAIITAAYDLSPVNLRGAEDWMSSLDDAFQLEAKAEDSATATLDQLRHMLRTLLADRFKLRFHRETQEYDGYVLVVEKEGSRLKAAQPDGQGRCIPRGGAGQVILEGQACPISGLVEWLIPRVSLPVRDRTGLPDGYDFTLVLNRLTGVTEGGGKKPPAGTPNREFDPPVPTAVREQLGLLMESQKIPVEFLVIDHAERPSDN